MTTPLGSALGSDYRRRVLGIDWNDAGRIAPWEGSGCTMFHTIQLLKGGGTMPRGGAREGAGRPPRQEPKSKPIWCGQMPEQDRALILETLEPQERYDALMDAVLIKKAKGEDNARL